MYQLLIFVTVFTVLGCYITKKLSDKHGISSKQRFWIGFSIPIVGALLYEWFDHHKAEIKRVFAKMRG